MISREESELTLEKGLESLSLKRSCDKCAHVSVCIVHKAVGSVLRPPNFHAKNRPFTVNVLANICSKFLSQTVAETLDQNASERSATPK